MASTRLRTPSLRRIDFTCQRTVSIDRYSLRATSAVDAPCARSLQDLELTRRQAVLPRGERGDLAAAIAALHLVDEERGVGAARVPPHPAARRAGRGRVPRASRTCRDTHAHRHAAHAGGRRGRASRRARPHVFRSRSGGSTRSRRPAGGPPSRGRRSSRPGAAGPPGAEPRRLRGSRRRSRSPRR